MSNNKDLNETSGKIAPFDIKPFPKLISICIDGPIKGNLKKVKKVKTKSRISLQDLSQDAEVFVYGKQNLTLSSGQNKEFKNQYVKLSDLSANKYQTYDAGMLREKLAKLSKKDLERNIKTSLFQQMYPGEKSLKIPEDINKSSELRYLAGKNNFQFFKLFIMRSIKNLDKNTKEAFFNHLYDKYKLSRTDIYKRENVPLIIDEIINILGIEKLVYQDMLADGLAQEYYRDNIVITRGSGMITIDEEEGKQKKVDGFYLHGEGGHFFYFNFLYKKDNCYHYFIRNGGIFGELNLNGKEKYLKTTQQVQNYIVNFHLDDIVQYFAGKKTPKQIAEEEFLAKQKKEQERKIILENAKVNLSQKVVNEILQNHKLNEIVSDNDLNQLISIFTRQVSGKIEKEIFQKDNPYYQKLEDIISVLKKENDNRKINFFELIIHLQTLSREFYYDHILIENISKTKDYQTFNIPLEETNKFSEVQINFYLKNLENYFQAVFAVFAEDEESFANYFNINNVKSFFEIKKTEISNDFGQFIDLVSQKGNQKQKLRLYYFAKIKNFEQLATKKDIQKITSCLSAEIKKLNLNPIQALKKLQLMRIDINFYDKNIICEKLRDENIISIEKSPQEIAEENYLKENFELIKNYIRYSNGNFRRYSNLASDAINGIYSLKDLYIINDILQRVIWLSSDEYGIKKRLYNLTYNKSKGSFCDDINEALQKKYEHLSRKPKLTFYEKDKKCIFYYGDKGNKTTSFNEKGEILSLEIDLPDKHILLFPAEFDFALNNISGKGFTLSSKSKIIQTALKYKSQAKAFYYLKNKNQEKLAIELKKEKTNENKFIIIAQNGNVEELYYLPDEMKL